MAAIALTLRVEDQPVSYRESQSGGTVDVCFRGSEHTVREAMAWYLRSYPALGYSTRFGDVRAVEPGVFEVRGSRFSSCD